MDRIFWYQEFEFLISKSKSYRKYLNNIKTAPYTAPLLLPSPQSSLKFAKKYPMIPAMIKSIRILVKIKVYCHIANSQSPNTSLFEHVLVSLSPFLEDLPFSPLKCPNTCNYGDPAEQNGKAKGRQTALHVCFNQYAWILGNCYVIALWRPRYDVIWRWKIFRDFCLISLTFYVSYYSCLILIIDYVIPELYSNLSPWLAFICHVYEISLLRRYKR